MNTLENDHDKRAYLLAYVFALVEKQFGFALEIAEHAETKTGDFVFNELRDYALMQMSIMKIKWPFFALKKRLDKAFNAIFR